MSENKDVGAADLLRDIPNEVLITELKRRALTAQQISELQALRPIAVEHDQIEATSSIDRLVDAIVRRSVYGKIPLEDIEVGGKKVSSNGSFDFSDAGPDYIPQSKGEAGLWKLIINDVFREQNNFEDLMNYQIVCISPAEDKGNRVLTMYFFQDLRQIDSRGYYSPARVSIEIPTGTAEELKDEITRNPDSLEAYYQKAFPGLDGDRKYQKLAGDNGKPGLRRVKTNGFLFVTGEKMAEASKFGPYRKPTEVQAFFGSLDKYVYQHGPYGTGETFTP